MQGHETLLPRKQMEGASLIKYDSALLLLCTTQANRFTQALKNQASESLAKYMNTFQQFPFLQVHIEVNSILSVFTVFLTISEKSI